MKTKIILVALLSCFFVTAYTQGTIPFPGTLPTLYSVIYCGLTYTYDSGGNRIIRQFNDCPVLETLIPLRDYEVSSVSVDSSNNNSDLFLEAVYPNPTGGITKLVFNAPVQSAQLTIINNLGKIIYTGTVSGIQIPVDLSAYASGLYYVAVYANGQNFGTPLVKFH